MTVPIRIGFLVVRLFPMYVLLLATDALRLANKYAGARDFDWVLISDEGRAIEASNGIRMECDLAVDDARTLDYAFVLAGDDQSQTLTRPIRQWLQRISRSTAILGAIDSGVFLLAESRVVCHRSVAVHPGAVSAFREQYPGIEVRPDPVIRDGSLVTCAGGLSVVKLMLSLIKEHCGAAVAQAVAQDMVISPAAAVDRAKFSSDRGTGASCIDEVIELMEQAFEEPLSLQEISDRVRRSRRQVTRQFRQAFGGSPMDCWEGSGQRGTRLRCRPAIHSSDCGCVGTRR